MTTPNPEGWVERMRELRARGEDERRDLLAAAKAAVPSRVRAFRAGRGWSQAQLAAVLGLHVNAIRSWENGRNAPPPYVLELALRYIEEHPEIQP